jgi:DNA-binding IclR family transcriptional regulator
MPLTRSATGGVFLAYLPRESTARWVKRDLLENARHGVRPTTDAELAQTILQTRQRGVARTSDFLPGIAGIAAPVFDSSGAIVLALIALGYSKPFDAEIDAIMQAVSRTAAALSRRLGFRNTAQNA